VFLDYQGSFGHTLACLCLAMNASSTNQKLKVKLFFYHHQPLVLGQCTFFPFFHISSLVLITLGILVLVLVNFVDNFITLKNLFFSPYYYLILILEVAKNDEDAIKP